jgi:hypothetical protein
MGDKARVLHGSAIVDGLLQGVEGEACGCGAADAPSHDPARMGVDDEG